jgi:predicted  nucleic acid-binding Zn-ribbon protein
MSRVSNLHRLQHIDLEIDRFKARSSEIESILQDNQELTNSRQRMEAVAVKLKECKANNKTAEHTVETQKEKIKATEGKLYGGTVTNPKELQDLQMESESLKRYLVTLEDQLLDTMVELEGIEEEHHQAVVDFELVEAKQIATHAKLVEEREEARTLILRLENEREAAVVGISDEDLLEYDRLRARLGGVAIAKLVDGACAACGLAQAASIQQTIRTGAELVKCSQCNRVLYSG